MKKKIVLTGRPPVIINMDDWPCIAEAKDTIHDGEVECQANRVTKFFVQVRQHRNKRAIVYAVYSYTSVWTSDRNLDIKRGVLLTTKTSDTDICDAILAVCEEMKSACGGEDGLYWPELAAQCIEDMPAETLK